MPLYDDVYSALEAAGVRFVVVGGMAVVLSGHVRATVDLDVVVDLAPDAALRAMEALTGLGLLPRVPVAPRDFANAEIREGWIKDKHMQVLSTPDERVALLEELLKIAEASGALQRAREEKQRQIDKAWACSP